LKLVENIHKINDGEMDFGDSEKKMRADGIAFSFGFKIFPYIGGILSSCCSTSRD